MNMNDLLQKMLREYAEQEGTTLQAAVRDAIVEIHHLSDELGLDFDLAIVGAEECYREETEEIPTSADED